MPNFENKLIQVCDKCLRATCWHGDFMCEDSRDAGIVLKTVSELRALKLEHSERWADDMINKIFGDPAPDGYRDQPTQEDTNV